MMKVFINTDGASRGNPGQAAAAFIIQDEGGYILDKKGFPLGVMTNNEAEYQAVKMALAEIAQKYKNELPLSVVLKSDSQLVVNQLSGRFKIKNERLKKVIMQVKELEKKIGHVSYYAIPRKENYLADQMANHILDGGINED